MTDEKKAAKAAYQKAWYQKNKARHLANVKKINDAAKATARDHVQTLKESGPCVDCGIKYPHYVMQYDHLNDKRMDVSRMVQSGYSIAAIDSEIAKCELVCSNCHCIRTWFSLR